MKPHFVSISVVYAKGSQHNIAFQQNPKKKKKKKRKKKA